jgi:hypothetical protein
MIVGPNANFIGVGESEMFGGLPVFGSWKIDRTTGKTEFCISGTTQCTEVTPQ